MSVRVFSALVPVFRFLRAYAAGGAAGSRREEFIGLKINDCFRFVFIFYKEFFYEKNP